MIIHSGAPGLMCIQLFCCLVPHWFLPDLCHRMGGNNDINRILWIDGQERVCSAGDRHHGLIVLCHLTWHFVDVVVTCYLVWWLTWRAWEKQVNGKDCLVNDVFGMSYGWAVFLMETKEARSLHWRRDGDYEAAAQDSGDYSPNSARESYWLNTIRNHVWPENKHIQVW